MSFEVTNTRVILNLTSLTVFLFVIIFYGSVRSTPSKAFRRATSRNRTDLCPSDPIVAPYASIAVDKLDLPSKININCPPQYSLCSWKCTLEPSCMSFVFKANTNRCDFYSSAPQTCPAVSGCVHFESNVYGQRSCGTEVLSLTADDEIRHLYIDGWELTNLPNALSYRSTDSVPFPMTASLIAIEIFDRGGSGGLLASSATIVTDGTWKVSINYTSEWMDVDFDDSAWVDATTYGYNGVRPWNTQRDISDNAQWISNEDNFDSSIYFRYHLKSGDA